MATDPTPTQQSWAMDCGWLTDWSFTEASLHPEQRTLLTRGRAQLLWFTTGYLFHHAPQAIPWIWEEIDLLNMPARLMKYCHAGGCLSSTHWFLWIYFISFIFCWFSWALPHSWCVWGWKVSWWVWRGWSSPSQSRSALQTSSGKQQSMPILLIFNLKA